jgi:hypothetical protein
LGTPDLEGLKSTLVNNNRYVGWCTVTVFVGLIVEYTILLWPKWNELKRWERIFTVIAGLAIAGGVYGEYFFGSNAADAALNIENISEHRVAELNAKAEDSAKEAAHLRKQAAELESRVAWRRLSKEQQSTIADHLKRFAGLKVVVSYLGGDPEAQQFAEDIAAALRAVKCQVPPMEPFSLFGGFGGGIYPLHPLTGVDLPRAHNRSSRDLDDAIQSELCSVGFDATAIGKLPLNAPEIDVLVVGRPNSPQGLTELKINTRTPTRTCTASP